MKIKKRITVQGIKWDADFPKDLESVATTITFSMPLNKQIHKSDKSEYTSIQKQVKKQLKRKKRKRF